MANRSSKAPSALDVFNIKMEELYEVSFLRSKSKKIEDIPLQDVQIEEVFQILSRAKGRKTAKTKADGWFRILMADERELFLRISKESVGPDVPDSKSATRWFFSEEGQLVISRMLEEWLP